jgi:outer membrane protein W
MNNKTTVEDNGHEVANLNTDNQMEKFDIGLQGSAGLNFKVARNAWLNTDVSYYHGLKDVSKSVLTNYRNRNLGVNVGLTFGIGTYKEK